MATDSDKANLPTATRANLGATGTMHLGVGSLFCCPSCKAWTMFCGVGFCCQESVMDRAVRKAARADAIRYQVFQQRWQATKPQAVPA